MTPAIAKRAAYDGFSMFRLLHLVHPHILDWKPDFQGNALIIAIDHGDLKLVDYILSEEGDPVRDAHTPTSRWAHVFSPLDV